MAGSFLQSVAGLAPALGRGLRSRSVKSRGRRPPTASQVFEEWRALPPEVQDLMFGGSPRRFIEESHPGLLTTKQLDDLVPPIDLRRSRPQFPGVAEQMGTAPRGVPIENILEKMFRTDQPSDDTRLIPHRRRRGQVDL